MSIQIRFAAPEDSDAVYTLLCELEHAPLAFEAFREVYLENLNSPAVRYWIASDEGKPVGFVSLHHQNLLHHLGPVGEIQELVVTQEIQSRGIGKALFEAARDYAEQTGCVQLEVCCNRARTQSHPFYLARGLEQSHYKFCQPLKHD